ncbi:MAG: hypothetical protein KDB00_13250 [Planctomycetales bacterium]|nr:hypothetical protein [Planctomycetales bacterium]
MRQLQIGILLLGVLLVLGGAVGGIVLPIVASARSGEMILSTELEASDRQAIFLSPDMNPLRAAITVTYDAPGRRLSGHRSSVSSAMRHLATDEVVWTIDTSFSDDDLGSDETSIDAGREHRTVNLQEFECVSADDYVISTEVKLNDSFTLQTVTLEVRQNVEPLRWSHVVIGALMIPAGVALILMTAFWIIKNPRKPHAIHGLPIPDPIETTM